MSNWKKAAAIGTGRTNNVTTLKYLSLPTEGQLCLVWSKASGVLTGPTFWSEGDRAWRDLLGPNRSRTSGVVLYPDTDTYWLAFELPVIGVNEPSSTESKKKVSPAGQSHQYGDDLLKKSPKKAEAVKSHK